MPCDHGRPSTSTRVSPTSTSSTSARRRSGTSSRRSAARRSSSSSSRESTAGSRTAIRSLCDGWRSGSLHELLVRWAEAELLVQGVRIRGVEEPLQPGIGAALHRLAHELDAEATPAVGGQDVDVSQVGEGDPVRDGAREAELPVAAVTRGALKELGRRFAVAEPEATIVLTPHNVHIEGSMAVILAGQMEGEEPVPLACPVDRELALAALGALWEADVPAVGVSFGG